MNKKLFAILLILSLLLGTLVLTLFVASQREGPAEVPPNLASLVQQANFIFKGSFDKLQASTLPEVPASQSTATVKVEEVLQASKPMSDFNGQLITVQLKDPQSAKVGRQAVFFTTFWMFGSSLAVREIDRVNARGDLTALRQQIASAQQHAADQALQKRLAGAELVVQGKVSRTGPAPPSGERRPITFHDPKWWEAVLEVVSVEKGKLAEKTVTVYFPTSRDKLWVRVPRFHPGQEGIWILHQDRQVKGAASAPGCTALDPLDFQPADQLERIQKLLRASQ